MTYAVNAFIILIIRFVPPSSEMISEIGKLEEIGERVP